MPLGLFLGALTSFVIGRLGRLTSKRLAISSLVGALCCASLFRLAETLVILPPSSPQTEGLTWLISTIIDLQWIFWWMLGGSLIPLFLTFMLGLTRFFGPVVIGSCAGLGAGLLALTWMNYSPVPSFTGLLWRTGMGVQGILCICCALATSGVQRLRSEAQQDPS